MHPNDIASNPVFEVALKSQKTFADVKPNQHEYCLNFILYWYSDKTFLECSLSCSILLVVILKIYIWNKKLY